MIIRVRSCVGTWRLPIDGDDMMAIKLAIQNIHGIEMKLIKLSIDPGGESLLSDNSSKLIDLDMSHGGMVFLQGNVVREKNGGFTIEKEGEEEGEEEASVNTIQHINTQVSNSRPSPHRPPDDTEVRKPDSVVHERMVEEGGLDDVDLVMDMAATAVLFDSSTNKRAAEQHSADSDVGSELTENMRKLLSDSKQGDLDWVDSMASEVMRLRNSHPTSDIAGRDTDESLARLLQLAEAEVDAAMSPQLYDSFTHDGVDSDEDDDDDDVLNEAIQRSMMSSTTAAVVASYVAAPSNSGMDSGMNRASLARRRVDHILESNLVSHGARPIPFLSPSSVSTIGQPTRGNSGYIPTLSTEGYNIPSHSAESREERSELEKALAQSLVTDQAQPRHHGEGASSTPRDAHQSIHEWDGDDELRRAIEASLSM